MIDTGNVLDVRDLSASYDRWGWLRGTPARWALRHVDLRVGRGEIVGLVGESGSGKSTLALMVLGLGPPAATGEILINGHAAQRALKEDRSAVQTVFQDPYSSLDPRQRIDRGLKELRTLHRSRSAWITDAQLLALVGLPGDAGRRYPHQLSGGQLQRVCIARALLLRPSLLIADEPTSSLDVSVQAQIVLILADLRRTTDLSILFISHDLALVRQISDRVYILEDGRMVESGDTEAVFTQPKDAYTVRLLDALPGMKSGGPLLRS